ncbi:hypothetical protein [Clostridium brassicae]|uniref:Ribbon-helix-helix protein, CopG family n=1 Tax=Clostridium brassicae TaxID=2999072 RepID=A0ABT4D6C1_9CLOT|nr:hypothetical protein [Clostridium brassicae]MCY6957849.1 hypothetical protein [Clostridium brassicae]
MDKRELKQKTLYIFQDQDDMLKRISKEHGEESYHIRAALDQYLGKFKGEN